MANKNKEKKKKAREKRLAKERNIRKNQAGVQFYLMVDFPDEGGWKRMMNFKDKAEVEAYLEETQKIRDAKDTKIFEGAIYTRYDRKVSSIPAYEPPDGVTPNGAADVADSTDLAAAKGD